MDADGNARPLTPDELQEYMIEESDDVEYEDDGTVWFIYRDQKTDITDKFKNGFCHIKVMDENKRARYFTIKYEGGYGWSPYKYPDDKEFEN